VSINTSFTCTLIVAPASSQVLLTRQCPVWNREWLCNAGVCYVAWVPCAILFALCLAACNDTSGCDGEGAIFFLVLAVFVVGWGLLGGVLTAYVLPHHPNCASDTEMGVYVAISHASIIMLVSCVVVTSSSKSSSESTEEGNALGGCAVLTSVISLIMTIVFSFIALQSVGGASHNTCLACGRSCTIEPSRHVAWASLDELNGRVHSCQLVNCWDATETELGGYNDFLSALPVPPAQPSPSGSPPPPLALVPQPPPPPEEPPDASGGDAFDAGSGSFESADETSNIVTFSVVLGLGFCVMMLGAVLWRRDTPLREKPRLILTTASQQAHEVPVVVATWVPNLDYAGASSRRGTCSLAHPVATVVGVEVGTPSASASAGSSGLLGGSPMRSNQI